MSGKLLFSAIDERFGSELWSLDLGAATACVPNDEALCLNGGRFRVTLNWRDFEGRTGRGQAVPLTGETGYFWFFDPANVESVVKVLDGRGLNDHFWVFYGALSNVEYTLAVEDTQTGLTRHYFNPSGRLASVGDTTGFGPLGAFARLEPVDGTALEEPIAGQGAVAASCSPTSTRLCLNGGRFAVEASWKDFTGQTGSGTAVSLTGDTGYFWFFDSGNVEVVTKVLDGRALNSRFWFFYGALSNVEYSLKVMDTATGQQKTYRNPAGRFGSDADVGAF